MKDAAICIATYKRSEGLNRLLCALREQAVPAGWRIEVRVVNNDPSADRDRFAREVDNAFPGACTAHEPRRNIACARNAAIAMGPADAYLFIDDDEVPGTPWLNALLGRLDGANAAVFGPVIGRVPDATSRWLVNSGVFDKPGPDHDGELTWSQTRTSSTAVDAAWLGHGDRWFNAEYGTSGGSDVEFFKQIAAEGARFVHERTAFVYEDVEAERCNWRAVLKRRYRAGAVHGRMERQRGTLHRHASLLKRIGHGSALATVGLIAAPVRGPGLLFHGACRLAIGIGAWRGHNPAYTVTRYPAKTPAPHTAPEGIECASHC